MNAAYTPALRPAELRDAARTLEHAAHLVTGRGRDSRDAAAAIAAAGFAGPAANAGLSRLDTFAYHFISHAHVLRYIAQILASAGSAQQKLDELADVAANTQRIYLIRWLNMVSWLLDSAAAQAVRTAILGTVDETFDKLVHHPNESLEQIHARNLATVPASTAQAVQEVGGVILEAGPQRATVMVGDTDAPTRVITLVGGVSTGRPRKLPGDLARASTIAESTGAAVVVWQGYIPPADVAEGIDPVAARTGGEELSAFQLAVEDRFPSAQKSVVAHSYGTVVATRAATGAGLFADDVWLLGSPGVPARSVGEMKLYGAGDPRVFVVDSDRDPILALRYRELGAHGTSPSHPSFGATPIPGVEGGHLAYFDDPDLLRALSSPPRE
ncbi:alpha/beta hydrolase [Corynebacterium sp. LK2510]|uniref:alpha/beta hydrolase n=1 Tax=Corynebacterium sp. LK2510 TaxID=3110472 RepID=UPI0034CE335E